MKIKVLKAKQSHPQKQTFLISDLGYTNKTPYPHKEKNKDTWLDEGMNNPIEVIEYGTTNQPRKGVGGVKYIEKKYKVKYGSSRVNAAIKKGYNAIEGILVNE
jgi:hypothetical protein